MTPHQARKRTPNLPIANAKNGSKAAVGRRALQARVLVEKVIFTIDQSIDRSRPALHRPTVGLTPGWVSGCGKNHILGCLIGGNCPWTSTAYVCLIVRRLYEPELVPLYVPRMLEAHKKRETLEECEAALRYAIGHSASQDQLQKRAAKVREAQIAALKDKIELIHYRAVETSISEKEREAIVKQLADIDEGMADWAVRSDDQIIEEYRAKHT